MKKCFIQEANSSLKGVAIMAPGENHNKIVEIKIDKIDVDPNHPRETTPAVERLARSMKSVGQLHPVYLVENEDRYTLVVGRGRYEAAKLNKQTTLACIVLSEEEKIDLLRLDENLMRSDLDPFEEGKGFDQLAKSGMNHATIANRYRPELGRTGVSQTINLRRIPEFLREKIRSHCQNSDSKVSREALYIISRQEVEEMEAAWEIYLDGGVVALRAMEKPEKEPAAEPAKKKEAKGRIVQRINEEDWGVTIRANGAKPDARRVVEILEKALEIARAKAAKDEGDDGDDEPPVSAD